MSSKKINGEEYESFEYDGFTFHSKKSKEVDAFFNPPVPKGKPLESHKMLMLDMGESGAIQPRLIMSKEDLDKFKEEIEKNRMEKKRSIPVFPEVRVVMTEAPFDSRHRYSQQKIVIRSRVRVPDDEGNNYLSMVMQEVTMPPTEDLETRCEHIAQAISMFNKIAYTHILLGKPNPDLEHVANGIRGSFFELDSDTRTERQRMKEMNPNYHGDE